MNRYLLVYTRNPKEEYTHSLGNSIHFACRCDDEEFTPLNFNYGIIFPEATISKQNTICEKGIKNPYIFHEKDGSFGIIAVRTAGEGIDDEESRGTVIYWTSADLINFDCRGLIRLDEEIYVNSAVCKYDNTSDNYEITWEDNAGNIFINYAVNLINSEISRPEKADSFPYTPPAVSLPDINPGNTIQVEPGIYQAMYNHWTPMRHIKTIVPDEITITSPGQLGNIKATVAYSNGETAQKQVKWDTSKINFSIPGVYDIKGKVTTPSYGFPLARSYADPVILLHNDKYYFIATNDNKNDIGLYVREADTIEELFREGFSETVILDADEEKGFVQTFWAPEFHYIGGDLYILFAVGGKQWGPQCHIMKLKKNGSIINPDDWETPVRVRKNDGTYLTEDGITLDMTYFAADGKSYVIWSYRYGIGTAADTGSMLYIAQIDDKDPSRLISGPVLLSRPLLSWENMQGTINNEGPYPLVTDDTVYIAYSGGAARGYTYSIGVLSIPRGSDYLDITKWKKSITPAVNYLCIDGLYGAGHNSFFCDRDGNIMIAYHAEEEIIGHGPACSAMHRVHIKQDGSPVFNLDVKRDLDEKLSNIQTKLIYKIEAAGNNREFI